ncbi:MAG TPA: radical SAM protein [Candidatus Nanoarchaeia archaeon]|nr:radical SAM protein [Candidatus Nanoarchaeia archaeon]
MVSVNKYYSYTVGNLPIGCRHCVRGEKLVLFVTGKCPRRCYFCPVSDKKFGQDFVFANERIAESEGDVLLEAELMNAKGAGITGGDPLMRIERTLSLIKRLKKKYGRKFHIHLYTSLNLVSGDSLKQLHNAGLDEIRFHLDLDSDRLWQRILLAKKFDWDVGVELPIVPGKEKELKRVIDFIHDKADFLNLNELEVADNRQSNLLEMGFIPKDRLSYAVKDSLQLGLKLLRYAKKYDMKVHLCTAKLKDAVQLSRRIKRESKGVRRKFDIVDREGILTRGALYLKELCPGFDYRKRLESINKKRLIGKLKPKLQGIKKRLGLKDSEIHLDEIKPRILLSSKNAKKHKSYLMKLGLLPAIVKEYPTADQLEVEVEFL